MFYIPSDRSRIATNEDEGRKLQKELFFAGNIIASDYLELLEGLQAIFILSKLLVDKDVSQQKRK